MANSFYDLDYIIEINEKRSSQFKDEYEKVVGRVSNIIVVYTALSLFFIPIAEDILARKMKGHISFWVCLGLFSILFLLSFYYTVKFLLPERAHSKYAEVAPHPPKDYYTDARRQVEQTNYINANKPVDEAMVNNIVKVAYITELEGMVDRNMTLVARKKGFYNSALRLGMLSILPFIVCLYFHVIADDKIQKIKIENIEKCCNFTIDTTGGKCVITPVVPKIVSPKKQ